MSASGVVQINEAYLNNLKTTLNDILTEVDGQLTGMGTTGVTSDTTNFINPVDSALTVQAGPSSFEAGAALVSALKAMGGSVQEQLEWLKKVLTDMISEITTTVNSFSSTESLNNEAVDQLISDFQNTISDMSNPGSSSTSNPNTPSS
jgi:hypothetical protein